MKVVIATDAWAPQINGVVQTLGFTIGELNRRGVETRVVSPDLFPHMPMPGYPEISLAWPSQSAIRDLITTFRPDHIHIATEGPIGWAVRHICLSEGRLFTTSYHTRFPEYLRARLPVPLELSYRALRRFHNAGQGIMVATPSIEQELRARGFQNTMRWSRGVDLDGFHPAADETLAISWPRPIFLYVGRLAPEKNLDAFLSLALPGTKLVIGDGPAGEELRTRYPEAVFLGARSHAALPPYYAHADVFVFPSRTDTFGLVLIEALACGLPVAAFPAPGPQDVVGGSGCGIISGDLRAAALAALRIDRNLCRRQAESFTWERATTQFLANVRQSHLQPRERARAA
ncbi:MAG: glycosyltransferase family 1 protein [Methylocystis sp.]|nr:glycosyltransferase family 1 protein [Methylocystis sp.]MCA3584819.1 glycosyltransferase family 1 protein [Methylocystis sp.]MCA3587518.1 glycosyltransferase family 1 protein [Methylocystis sp.]MCA3593014.1 glycosyltransferase family 1 protein [Methylocystis sp.]